MEKRQSVQVLESKTSAQQDASSLPTRDYQNPDQIAKMGSRLIPKNLKEMPKMMLGPRCFNCFQWGTFFSCEECRRAYHRECVFMNNRGFPMPIFSEPVEVVMRADWGAVKLLKCSNCLVEEKTCFPQLRETSQEDLNKALVIMASKLTYESLLEPVPTDGPFPVTLEEISKKARQGLYKTLEQFYGDYRRILYNLIAKYSLASDAADLGEKMLEKVGVEMKTVLYCLECYLKRGNSAGQLLNEEQYRPINVHVCKVPHPLVWVKEPNLPYWPSKLLVSGVGRVVVQCFGGKAAVRVIEFQSNSKDHYDIQTYSVEIPGSSITSNPSFLNALTDCEAYLQNLRARFGEAGVIIPKEAKQFDGDMNALLRAQFPNYQLPQ